MTSDPQSFKRATSFSLLGLALQLVLGIALLIYSVIAHDHAAQTAAYFVLCGSSVWLVLAVVYDQHRRERMEALEAESLSAQAARQSTVFEENAEDLRVAAKRLAWMHRILVPAFSLVLAGVLIGLGIWRYMQAVPLLDHKRFTQPVLPYWAITIGLTMAVAGFLFARFISGMAKQAVWSNLRAGAAQLVGASLLGLAMAVGQFVLIAGADQVLIYVQAVFPLAIAALGGEFILNFVLTMYRPRRPGEIPRPAFDSRVLGFIAAPDKIAESIGEAINYQFGFDVTGSWFYQLLSRSVAWLVVLGAGLVWLMSVLAVVGPDERGLRLRNGRLVEEVGPGPYLKLPWPFESIERFKATEARRIDLAAPAPDPTKPVLWTNEHTTGEENFYFFVQSAAVGGASEGEAEISQFKDIALVSIQVPVYYAVRNVEKFERLGATQEARDAILRAEGQRVLLGYIATCRLDDILGPGQVRATTRVGELVSKTFADLDCGVEVLFAGIAGMHPPVPTAATFEQVVAAQSQRQANITEAEKAREEALTKVAGSVEVATAVLKGLDELDALRARGANESELAEKSQAIERLLAQGGRSGGGSASVLIHAAKADRWATHMGERGRAEAYAGQLAAYRTNPRYFRASFYFDALKSAIASTRLYIVADDMPVEVRTDLLDVDTSSNPLTQPEVNTEGQQ